MKLLKYLLLIIGILGLIAAIYNIVHTGYVFGHKMQLFSGLILIIIARNIENLSGGFKSLLNTQK